MKKLVCLILALALCMSVTAMAENTPSKTTADLTKFTVSAANQQNDSNLYLLPINDLTKDAALPAHEEQTAIVQAEITKLSSEGAESYFANVTDSEGNTVDLRKELGLDADAELKVSEFCQMIAGGFEEDCGDVTANMLFPTPYEKGQKVYVLVGIVEKLENGEQKVTWHAFEGEGMGAVAGENESYGSIQVTFTPEIVKAIKDGTALMAVVSK